MIFRLVGVVIVFVASTFLSTVVLTPLFGDDSVLPLVIGLLVTGLTFYPPATAYPPFKWTAALVRWFTAVDDKTKTAQSRRIAVFNARPTITVFETEVPRPAFLDKVSNFYHRPHTTPAWYRGRSDRIVSAGIVALDRNERNERRLLESMIESARLEMYRRSVPIVTRLNEEIWPEIHDAGLLIETVELDDGNLSHIIAYDVGGAINEHEWLEADRLRIGNVAGAWNEWPRANRLLFLGDDWKNPGTGVMPLYRLKLREIITPPERSNQLADQGVGIDRPVDLPHA